MGSLARRVSESAEIPGFDDGTVNAQEPICVMAENACADANQRNGCRERTPVTSAGAINLRTP